MRFIIAHNVSDLRLVPPRERLGLSVLALERRDKRGRAGTVILVGSTLEPQNTVSVTPLD